MPILSRTFSKALLMDRMVLTPTIEPIRVNGARNAIKRRFVFFEHKYLKELVKEEKLAESLFVPNVS
jgi:hypothetical protein